MDPGHVIADRFVIEREAGAGGMGTVYRATDRSDGATIALKLLKSSDLIDVQRFDREARTLAGLEHPGVVRYIAHGHSESGDAWLAMEWLEGETLDERFDRGISLIDAIEVVRRTAEALGVAHARGIVHRDLKPANLFLVDKDASRVKVLDFGIARALTPGMTLTSTGTAMGTPYYMAPEQARGEKVVDPRTDIYSLGCVLYEALAGEPPFPGDSPIAVLAKILLEEPKPLAERRVDIPESVAELVTHMLDKRASGRPDNGAALVSALDKLGDLHNATFARPSHVPATLGSDERRLVCVVMVAGVAVSSMSARTMPSATGGHLQGNVREVVATYAGRVEFLADGSMVATVTGRGVATDQAARAARCALELRELIPDEPIVLVAGRGIITARLPVGEVIDRGVAVLAQLEAKGQRMPVRIDTIIDGLLDDRFERRVEGEARYLMAMMAGAVVRDTLLGIEIPCVGRRRELANLQALYEECAEEPVARVALVTSGAGGGKSRLCHEWLARLAMQDEPPTVLFGRGDPMRAGSPLALFADAIRRSAQIRDGESLARRRARLEHRLSRVLGGDDKTRIQHFLGEIARVPYPDDASDALNAARQDPRLMADLTRAALEDWLRAECEAGPVVLVLEDLHWGDAPTVRLVDTALPHLEELPLLVVAFGRPVVFEQFPGLWSERDLQHIRLARLTRRSSEKLVRAALGDEVEGEVVAAIVEQGDGNAFYLEELVRAVAGGATEGLPATVLGMVEARLDALDPEARRVLRACAVFGQRFWRGGVQMLVGDTPHLDDWLEGLVAAEMIAPAEESALRGELEWSFRHDLVRETAYAMLTGDDRRLGHRLAGEWLEAAGGTNPLELAEHYVRGGLGDKAAEHYRSAAQRALDANDHEAAVERAGCGLSAAPTPEVRAELLLLVAEAQRWRGEYELAADSAHKASQLAAAGSSDWFAAVGNAVVAAGQLGDKEAIDEWVEAAALAVPAPDATTAVVVCLCRAAHQRMATGAYAAADALLAKAEAHVGDLDQAEPLVSAWLHTTRAARDLHASRVGAYLDGTTAAVRAYDRAGDVRHACNQRARLGYGLAELGFYEEAQAELEAALAQARRLGLTVVEGFATQNLGHVLALRGQSDAARAALGRAMAIGEKLENAALFGGAHFYLADLALSEGDASGAVEHAKLAVTRLTDTPPLRTLAVAMLARGLLAQAKVPDALAMALQAVDDLSTLTGMEEGETLVFLAHGLALEATGRLADAREVARASVERLQERAARLDEARRQRFLTAVPEHVATLALAARLDA